MLVCSVVDTQGRKSMQGDKKQTEKIWKLSATTPFWQNKQFRNWMKE